MTITWVDTETVPPQDEAIKARCAEGVSAPANYKDPDKIAAYIEREADKEYRKLALNSTFGEICTIAWAHSDGQVHSLQRELAEPESVLLTAFWQQLLDTLPRGDGIFATEEWGISPKLKWGGQNVQFDLRYLWRRSIIHQVARSVDLPIRAKPWDNDVADTMTLWKVDRYDSASANMKDLCIALGIDYTDEIDGSMVYDAMLNGESRKVQTYCENDVRRTREIYNRITT